MLAIGCSRPSAESLVWAVEFHLDQVHTRYLILTMLLCSVTVALSFSSEFGRALLRVASAATHALPLAGNLHVSPSFHLSKPRPQLSEVWGELPQRDSLPSRSPLPTKSGLSVVRNGSPVTCKARWTRTTLGCWLLRWRSSHSVCLTLATFAHSESLLRHSRPYSILFFFFRKEAEQHSFGKAPCHCLHRIKQQAY